MNFLSEFWEFLRARKKFWLFPIIIVLFLFGLMLGRLISPVIMAIIFFLIVTPVALIMKVARKDSMRKKYNKKAKSYWLKRQYPISTMKRQF